MAKIDKEWLAKKKAKRLQELTSALNAYSDNENRLKYAYSIKTDSAQEINNVYWDEVWSPLIKHVQPKDGDRHLERFKIYAGLELAIMKVRPFKSNENNYNRESLLNSRFAFNTAFTYFKKWSILENHIQEKVVDNGKTEEELIKNLDVFLDGNSFRLYKLKKSRWLQKAKTNLILNQVVLSSYNWFLLYVIFCKTNDLVPIFPNGHSLLEEETNQLLKFNLFS